MWQIDTDKHCSSISNDIKDEFKEIRKTKNKYTNIKKEKQTHIARDNNASYTEHFTGKYCVR